jgi:hypothetical protein
MLKGVGNMLHVGGQIYVVLDGFPPPDGMPRPGTGVPT